MQILLLRTIYCRRKEHTNITCAWSQLFIQSNKDQIYYVNLRKVSASCRTQELAFIHNASTGRRCQAVVPGSEQLVFCACVAAGTSCTGLGGPSASRRTTSRPRRGGAELSWSPSSAQAPAKLSDLGSNSFGDVILWKWDSAWNNSGCQLVRIEGATCSPAMVIDVLFGNTGFGFDWK